MVYKLDTRTYPPARHTDYLEYCSSFHWTLCSRALVLTGPYPSPQLRLLFTHWGDYDLILFGYHLGPYILVGCSAPGFYEIVKAIPTICGPFRSIFLSFCLLLFVTAFRQCPSLAIFSYLFPYLLYRPCRLLRVVLPSPRSIQFTPRRGHPFLWSSQSTRFCHDTRSLAYSTSIFGRCQSNFDNTPVFSHFHGLTFSVSSTFSAICYFATQMTSVWADLVVVFYFVLLFVFFHDPRLVGMVVVFLPLPCHS